MDNAYKRPDKAPGDVPEPEFAPELAPGAGMPEFGPPDRDFPAVIPERSELPRRKVTQDELDVIPQQDEF